MIRPRPPARGGFFIGDRLGWADRLVNWVAVRAGWTDCETFR